jgi:integrase
MSSLHNTPAYTPTIEFVNHAAVLISDEQCVSFPPKTGPLIFRGRRGALALQFKWLSNKRGIEVQRMTPDQIDWRREIWSLPDVENKAKSVVQPLTPKMQAILREALGNRSGGYLFSTTGGEKKVSLSSKLQGAAVEAAGTPYISCHDYRRTFSTQLEEMAVPSRVISLTEGHYDRGIEAHYQQATVRPLDEQLEAYRKWEQFLGVGI